jgi:hypothetical protein
MKQLLYLFFLISFVFSCSQQPAPAKPNNFIPQEEMSQIMEEVMLLEAYYQKKYGAPSVYKDPLALAAKEIFKKHKISAKIYEDNFTYYAQQYEIFKEMNDAIIERLNKKIVKP